MNLVTLADLETPDDDTLTSRMRHRRDILLAASDWAVLPDAPTDKQAWETYRQQLRDFPSTWTAGPVAEFPDPPGV